jgi:hypothetical protein
VHSWPAQLVMVQPYSMLPLIKWDQRRVTVPNGAVVISEAMGTVRRLDPFVIGDPYSMIDIAMCLMAPRPVQLKYRAELGNDKAVIMVQVPGIEKIAAGVKERVPYGQKAKRERAAANDPLGA